MRSPLLVAAFAVACALSFPALAAPVCQFTLVDVEATLDKQGVQFIVLEPEERALFLASLESAVEDKTHQDFAMPPVTNVILAVIKDELYFGLEINGCITPPEPIGYYLPDVKRSGKTPFGIFA